MRGNLRRSMTWDGKPVSRRRRLLSGGLVAVGFCTSAGPLPLGGSLAFESCESPLSREPCSSATAGGLGCFSLCFIVPLASSVDLLVLAVPHQVRLISPSM